MNDINENKTSNSLFVKILVIIGFVATIILFIWLITIAVQQLSPSFASLANVADSKRDYKPADELIVETEKTVVNSGESFEIYWNDMKQTGEFKFTYTCKEGISVLVRDDQGSLMPIRCTEELSLPATVNGIFLSIDSMTSRFSDVDFSLAFVSSQQDITQVDDVKITVVNPSLPVEQEVAGESTETDEDGPDNDYETQPEVVPAPRYTQQETTYTNTYPQSYSSGYTDLSVKTLGIGEVRNGSFVYRGSLDSDERNAIKFDIYNKGTRTSNVWNFFIEIPGEIRYRSSSQAPLRPQEHAEFVLQFDLDEYDDDFIEIEIEVETNSDSNRGNNTSVWYASVDGSYGRGDVQCDSFTVSDSRVDEGDRVTLRWRTTNADDVYINNGVGDVDDDGSERVRVYDDTTFTLTARGDGDRDTCRVTVRVDDDDEEVQCDSFTVSDDEVDEGDYVTLRWRTSNADDVDINNGVGDVDDDGSERVRVYEDTTWTLTARGDGDRDTCRVSVDVD